MDCIRDPFFAILIHGLSVEWFSSTYVYAGVSFISVSIVIILEVLSMTLKEESMDKLKGVATDGADDSVTHSLIINDYFILLLLSYWRPRF